MRAQVWSSDFVVSAIMFFTVLFLIIFVWNYTNAQGQERLTFNNIETLALKISDSIIRIPGLPEDWNSSNVRVIGLASSDNVLNETKVSNFVGMSYTKARGLMSVQYQFYFDLKNITGDIIEESSGNLTAGIYPVSADIVVPVKRYVLYKGKVATMTLIIWT